MIVLDYILSDDNGLNLLPQIKKHWPDTEVIMLTGQGTMEVAAKAGKLRRLQFSLQAV